MMMLPSPIYEILSVRFLHISVLWNMELEYAETQPRMRRMFSSG